ncbi:MAG TPA: PAS domain S-box protein, partial [Candidatus Sulfotelmatobacter sp.]
MADPSQEDPTLERKLADDALRDSEARYRRLFETAQDGILILDGYSGLITDVNPFLMSLLDYPREEFIGKILWDIGPFKQIQESKEAFRELQDKEYVRYGNLPLKTRGGRRVNVEFVSNVYGVNGKRVIQCNIRDMSARRQPAANFAAQGKELIRQAEELGRSRQALEDKTLMLQSVLDSMSEGLVVADVEGKFIIWNPAAAKLLGLRAANIDIEEWSRHYGLYLPDTVTPFPSDQLPLARAIQGESSTAVMFVRNPEFAEGIFLEACASPLKDADGMLTGGVGAFRDVTESRRAEATLREYERVVEGLDEMILVVDRQYRYVIANRAFLNFRGMSVEQVIGQFAAEVVGQEVFATRVKEKMDECFLGNVVHYEMTYNFPDLGKRDLSVSYFPIEVPAGVDRIACVLRDITERRVSEEALR